MASRNSNNISNFLQFTLPNIIIVIVIFSSGRPCPFHRSEAAHDHDHHHHHQPFRHRFHQPPKTDHHPSLSFLVVGDWGRKGLYNQSQVAAQMGIIGEKLDVDFVISTGDNFYDGGLTGEDDPAFVESFSKIYTAPSLQKQWFTVLGNHDYRGDALAQFSPLLTQKDKRWLCLRTYVVDAEVVDFFFMDTTPFQTKYFTDPEDHKYDWRGVMPRKKYLKEQLKELDRVLKESNGKWKVVVGHHTLQSAGYHGSTQELVDTLLPVLKENNVDLYVNGHDHCLEHISSPDSGLQFLTSGGGSKAWKNEIHEWDPKTLKFYYDGQGLMSIHFTISELDIKFYDIFGNVLHQWSASKGHGFM